MSEHTWLVFGSCLEKRRNTSSVASNDFLHCWWTLTLVYIGPCGCQGYCVPHSGIPCPPANSSWLLGGHLGECPAVRHKGHLGAFALATRFDLDSIQLHRNSIRSTWILSALTKLLTAHDFVIPRGLRTSLASLPCLSCYTEP